MTLCDICESKLEQTERFSIIIKNLNSSNIALVDTNLDICKVCIKLVHTNNILLGLKSIKKI